MIFPFTSQTESISRVSHRTAQAASLRADAIGGWVDGPVACSIIYEEGQESLECSTLARTREELRERLAHWAPMSLLPEDWK